MNARSQLHEELMYGRPSRSEAATLIAAYRAEVLRETADAVERMRGYPTLVLPEEMVADLRRMADEVAGGAS